MSVPTGGAHASPSQIAAVAAGGAPSPELAGHLARCPLCRRALAELDPSAIFGLLAALPAAQVIPAFPAAFVRTLPSREGRGFRAALGAAAALVALGALLATLRPPREIPAAPAPPAAATQFLVRVDSPRAQVVTLVPAGANEPVVALIVGEEIDL